jgi:light-regulated signal transduction histidine kinase (bacteriophytochrome)
LGEESGPEFTRLYGALVDITERKLAEAEILRLNAELNVHIQQRTSELVATTAELDGFSYSVSHDLRAPLRSIDGWSLALLEDYGEKLDDTARSYIETVRAETKHMGQLVDGLLQISRATRREMTRETLDLAEIARTVSMAVAREAPERQVTFVIPEEVMVEGDTTLMRLALQNLLKNAFKFTRTREHAVIEFGVTDQGGVPTYFVRDNGVGFDPQFSHKLFQPFQRLHLKEEYPGSAIGLATVQRIIHRHGGRVWAEGEVEKGATFYFTLGGMNSEK